MSGFQGTRNQINGNNPFLFKCTSCTQQVFWSRLKPVWRHQSSLFPALLLRGHQRPRVPPPYNFQRSWCETLVLTQVWTGRERWRWMGKGERMASTGPGAIIPEKVEDLCRVESRQWFCALHCDLNWQDVWESLCPGSLIAESLTASKGRSMAESRVIDEELTVVEKLVRSDSLHKAEGR